MPKKGESLEEVLGKLKDDLRFCEESLKREVRIELVIKILDEILHYAEKVRGESSSSLKDEVEAIITRARLLYHRAVALNALKEREEARG